MKTVNQFAAEMDHFCECMLNNQAPRTPGELGGRPAHHHGHPRGGAQREGNTHQLINKKGSRSPTKISPLNTRSGLACSDGSARRRQH
jgi:hypothetical protein